MKKESVTQMAYSFEESLYSKNMYSSAIFLIYC
jgi:hypothetical protein